MLKPGRILYASGIMGFGLVCVPTLPRAGTRTDLGEARVPTQGGRVDERKWMGEP
jgi:hypothetical protein